MEANFERISARRGGREARKAARAAAPLPGDRPVRPGMIGGRYKPMTDVEIRRIHETALDVLEHLLAKGVVVEYHDPLVPVIRAEGHLPELHSVELTAERLQQADVVILVTDHSAFDYEWITDQAQLIFDTRNAFKRVTRNREKIRKL